MTIRIDIRSEVPLAELVAHVKAGEEVLLTQDGQDVVALNLAKTEPQAQGRRIPGLYAHLGKLEDPYLFLRPDPELEEAADGPIYPTEK
ncbi:hypothetical protein V7S57_15090 [Caulobacter sp. CCNWLY153]|jgi:antitoxin (DNA-binding transcriptional repressor) of toxin-antitoxin stability system|uniref:hypothetical protein n=1 Tax=Caulobacter TaxID=75 RepID=UPI001057AB2E|nr:hypothetical protein [Caulobacter radicis]